MDCVGRLEWSNHSFPVNQECVERMISGPTKQPSWRISWRGRHPRHDRAGGCLVVLIATVLGLLAAPWIVDAAHKQEPTAMRRQIDALEVEFRETTDRIAALEAARARDAETIQSLRAALSREGAQREALNGQLLASSQEARGPIRGTPQDLAGRDKRDKRISQSETVTGGRGPSQDDTGAEVEQEAGQRAAGRLAAPPGSGRWRGVMLLVIWLLSRRQRSEMRDDLERLAALSKEQQERHWLRASAAKLSALEEALKSRASCSRSCTRHAGSLNPIRSPIIG